MTTLDYLQRYQSGDFGAWDELVANAEEVMESTELKTHAITLAEEIMSRVKNNVSVLRKTLITAGTKINNQEPPLSKDDYAFLTNKFGPLPIALEAFYKIVGSINLTPKYDYNYGEVTLEEDEIWMKALDPLYIESATNLTFLLEEYLEHDDENMQFLLDLCPDFLHKQDISGGAPYAIELPPPSKREALDPKILHYRHELTFVNYLRHCFKWGGFPGLDFMERNDNEIDMNWRMGFEDVKGPWRPAYKKLQESLVAGLVEF